MFKKSLERICILLVLLLFVLLLVEVFLRSVLSMSISWSYEIARVLMVWLVFIGMLLLNLSSEHINISILENKFKLLAKVNIWLVKITLLIISMISIHFLSVIIPFGQVSSTTGLPQWIYYLILPIAFIFSLITSKYKG